MRVFLSSLGCKLNQAELEAATRRLRADGHLVVDRLDEADVHVVNTCTVTSAAARDSRKLARRGGRLGPKLKTVLTGCWATERPDEAAALPGVGLVVRNDVKEELVPRLYRAFPTFAAVPRAPGLDTQGVQAADELGVPVSYVPLAFGNTRAALKIEDGCNMRCAFCIIPSTRGRQSSRAPEEAITELNELCGAGVQEVVVTGVQISSYRHEGLRLHDLVERMLVETEVPRLRLTSIAPWQFDQRLMDVWQHERICRHVHLSLQSGCSPTLRRMRRPYTAARYRSLLDQLRGRVPQLAVTTDVIVGFPGETDEEFEQSLDFVRSCGFARTHVFTYSERVGTLAAGLPDPVPHSVRKERTARLIEVGQASRSEFERRQVGSRVQVLWEDVRDDILRGTTDNYLKVHAAQPRELRISSHEFEHSPDDGLVRLGGAGRSGACKNDAAAARAPGLLEKIVLRHEHALGLVA